MGGRSGGDYHVDGDLQVDGSITAASAGLTDTNFAAGAGIQRSKLQQESVKKYPLRLEDARIWDTATSFLPTAAVGDDLGLIQGTFATDMIEIQSSDASSATKTQYCRWPNVVLPPEYVDGQSVELHIRGKMQTVSDTTAVANWDAYVSDNDGTVTAVTDDGNQNINSITVTTYTTVLTATSLTKGDVLDLRLKIDITDAATGGGSNVTWEMYEAFLLLDIKG